MLKSVIYDTLSIIPPRIILSFLSSWKHSHKTSNPSLEKTLKWSRHTQMLQALPMMQSKMFQKEVATD